MFIRVHLWMVFLLCGGFSPAWAAFPQIGSTNTSVTTPASTNHVISLPSGISSGNLLLAMWGVDDATDGTWPTGWTEIVATTLPSNTGRLEVAYRIADGTEGTTITVTSISKTSSHITYRITGYSGTPQAGTTASGTSTNANPPSGTPSWGAKETLWIAVGAVDGTNITAAPTNYTDLLTGSVNTRLGSARRELNTATEDPSSFTNASDQWAANTIAIEPAAAGESVPPRRPVVITEARTPPPLRGHARSVIGNGEV